MAWFAAVLGLGQLLEVINGLMRFCAPQGTAGDAPAAGVINGGQVSCCDASSSARKLGATGAATAARVGVGHNIPTADFCLLRAYGRYTSNPTPNLLLS